MARSKTNHHNKRTSQHSHDGALQHCNVDNATQIRGQGYVWFDKGGDVVQEGIKGADKVVDITWELDGQRRQAGTYGCVWSPHNGDGLFLGDIMLPLSLHSHRSSSLALLCSFLDLLKQVFQFLNFSRCEWSRNGLMHYQPRRGVSDADFKVVF